MRTVVRILRELSQMKEVGNLLRRQPIPGFHRGLAGHRRHQQVKHRLASWRPFLGQ